MSVNVCPHCGSPNKPGARFCAHCGKPITSPLGQPQAPFPATPQPQYPQPQPPQAPAGAGQRPVPTPPGIPAQPPAAPAPGAPTNCPKCGVPLRPNSKFCAACGFSLGSTMTLSAAAAAMGAGAAAPAGGTQLLGAAGGVPNLVVRWPGGNTQRHPLTAPVIRIGRAPDNDIVINSPMVSGHHLRLEQQGGRMTITDLNSSNGTMINAQRIPPNVPNPFQAGDVIRIGDLTGNSISLVIESEAGASLRTLALGKLDLSSQPTVIIGRDPSSYLPLNHPTVSSRHAMIFRQDGTLYIRDLGSTNGTFVNGQRISQVPLSSGDVIQIGPFRLVYDAQQQSLAQSKGMGHRLDAIQLGREVKGGKMILRDVTMCIQSSEFVALVGGSGAGKSTLMKALNGYDRANHGQLLIDGEPFYPNLDLYKSQMGYVPQDDIIHRELPVRLALYYAAKLRLPGTSASEIDQRIREALEAVDMVEHAEKKVKVLSGGQRKRVSIAVELLAQPTLFFLDEPTSGLDPGLEKKMMYDMNQLADKGRTVVMVTHATANIDQCDLVAFLSYGRLAFYGPPNEALKFFNVKDFADIYLKLSQEIDPAKGKNPPQELMPYYQQYLAQEAQGRPGRVVAGILWAYSFRNSQAYQKYVADRQMQLGLGGAAVAASPGTGKVVRPRDSAIRQTIVLARRQFDLIRNDLRTMFILLLMMPFIAALFAVVGKERDLVDGLRIWSGNEYTSAVTGRGDKEYIVVPRTDSDDTDYDDVERGMDELKQELITQIEDELVDLPEDEDGNPKKELSHTPYPSAKMLLVMIGLAMTQGGTFAAAYEIVKESAIFKRERAVNLKVSAYVLSKILVLALFAVVQVAAVVLILGLRIDMDFHTVVLDSGYLEMFVTLYLAVLASVCFGLFISAMVPSTDVVLYIILAQLFIQIILSGALFPLPPSPASYIAPGYWTMNSLGSMVDLEHLNEVGTACKLTDQYNKDMPMEQKIKFCNPASATEDEKKNFLGELEHTKDHILETWAWLGGQAIAWTLLTIIVLYRKKIE